MERVEGQISLQGGRRAGAKSINSKIERLPAWPDLNIFTSSRDARLQTPLSTNSVTKRP